MDPSRPSAADTLGLTASRFCASRIVGKDDPLQSEAYASGRGWRDEREIVAAIRSAVMLNTVDAAAMMAPVATDFAEAVRPLTVLNRLALLRHAPPHTRLVGQTQGAVASWVGEAQPKPLTMGAFAEGTILTPKKVVAHAVVSAELARVATEEAQRFLLADLVQATAAAIDTAFLDPGNLGGNDRPASVTAGGPTIPSSGMDLAAIDMDLRQAIELLVQYGSTLEAATWIMSPRTATALAGMRGTDGSLAFPAMGARGGELLGIPALAGGSIASPGSPTEGLIILLDQDAILVADTDEATLGVSRDASLQMRDTPDSGAAQLVSCWQCGLAALRAERFISWATRRPGAAVTITGVNL